MVYTPEVTAFTDDELLLLLLLSGLVELLEHDVTNKNIIIKYFLIVNY